MTRALCRLGLHRWAQFWGFCYLHRACRRRHCGKLETRVDGHWYDRGAVPDIRRIGVA